MNEEPMSGYTQMYMTTKNGSGTSRIRIRDTCFGATVHVPVIHNYISVQQIFIADPRQKQEKFKPTSEQRNIWLFLYKKEPEKEKKIRRTGVVNPE
jgi:hypothetical protein